MDKAGFNGMLMDFNFVGTPAFFEATKEEEEDLFTSLEWRALTRSSLRKSTSEKNIGVLCLDVRLWEVAGP